MSDEQALTVPFVQKAQQSKVGDGGRLVRKRSDITKPACGHNYAVIDINARVLTCRDCNVTLDPIAFLVSLADYEQSIDRKLKEARKLHDENRARLERAAEVEREQPNVLRVLRDLKRGDRIVIKWGPWQQEATFVGIEWLSVVIRASECSPDQLVPIEQIEFIKKLEPKASK